MNCIGVNSEVGGFVLEIGVDSDVGVVLEIGVDSDVGVVEKMGVESGIGVKTDFVNKLSSEYVEELWRLTREY